MSSNSEVWLTDKSILNQKLILFYCMVYGMLVTQVKVGLHEKRLSL